MGAVELRNGATSFSVQQPLLLVLLLVSLATSFQQPFSAILLHFAKITLFGVLASFLALHMQAL